MKCYACFSVNKENPQCDSIDNDDYLINCKNDYACFKGVFENTGEYQ